MQNPMRETVYHQKRDHGGGLDAAIVKFGGTRADWVDLSTGINPTPYPVAEFAPDAWTALPDTGANLTLLDAARRFWSVPDGAALLAAPGASSLIATLPGLMPAGRVRIEPPTYNEHAAGFEAHGWSVVPNGDGEARVMVHPNNPDGRLWEAADANAALTVIDESFCDVTPDQSLIHLADQPGVIVLKSFGKFWGLAGLRLGFAIARPETIDRLSAWLGPWAVSGPALQIGAAALNDLDWANQTRARLAHDANRLDDLVLAKGAELVGGTSLFRLYRVDQAQAWQDRLARAHVWSRIFPYSETFLRLGLPPADRWDQVEAAL